MSILPFGRLVWLGSEEFSFGEVSFFVQGDADCGDKGRDDHGQRDDERNDVGQDDRFERLALLPSRRAVS